jgi:hypothetical protein
MDAVSAVVGLLLLAAPSDSGVVVREAFGQFSGARRLALSPQGWMLVVDEEANHVVVFPSRDQTPRVFGGFGWGTMALDRPTGICTDGLNIYLSDEGNHRVQRLDRTLSLVASLSKRDTTLERARFGYPRGIALSRHGDLFVLDGENTRVVAYTGGDFRYLRTFGDLEGGKAMLEDPLEVEVTPDDKVMVLERSRLVVFDYFGNPAGVIGEGILEKARGFGVTAAGVFVVSGDRLWAFTPQGALQWTVRRSSLGPLAGHEFSDVAISGEFIYVLTDREILLLGTAGL